MNQENQTITRTSVTGAGPSITKIRVVHTVLLENEDLTEAALEVRATTIGSVLEEILHHDLVLERYG